MLGADWPDRPAAFAVAVLLGAAAFAALGLAITTVVRTAEGSSAVVNAIFLPMAFISGVFFSTAEMPAFLAAISEVLPLTYFLELIRASFVPDESFARLCGPGRLGLGPGRPRSRAPPFPLGAPRGSERGVRRRGAGFPVAGPSYPRGASPQPFESCRVPAWREKGNTGYAFVSNSHRRFDPTETPRGAGGPAPLGLMVAIPLYSTNWRYAERVVPSVNEMENSRHVFATALVVLQG